MSELCYWTYIQHSSFNMVLNMIWCMREDSLNTTSSITHKYNRIHLSDSSFTSSSINIIQHHHFIIKTSAPQIHIITKYIWYIYICLISQNKFEAQNLLESEQEDKNKVKAEDLIFKTIKLSQIKFKYLSILFKRLCT
jgi:hypothetical protein